MFDIKKKVKKFDTDSSDDMQEYEDILNNPMCSILNECKEKLKHKTFDDEGKPLEEDDSLIKVVTWEERILV